CCWPWPNPTKRNGSSSWDGHYGDGRTRPSPNAAKGDPGCQTRTRSAEPFQKRRLRTEDN
ncbi:MAG: hypothetical protein AVDCRST_MAG14-458, partial [uncultured Rubrobacteraceae bacterium]